MVGIQYDDGKSSCTSLASAAETPLPTRSQPDYSASVAQKVGYIKITRPHDSRMMIFGPYHSFEKAFICFLNREDYLRCSTSLT